VSVGGKVCDVVRDDVRIWINTDDGSCNVAIYVERDNNSEQVTKGDVVWWQGRSAFWTTEDRKTHVETVLRRLGYSHQGKRKDLKEVKDEQSKKDTTG